MRISDVKLAKFETKLLRANEPNFNINSFHKLVERCCRRKPWLPGANYDEDQGPEVEQVLHFSRIKEQVRFQWELTQVAKNDDLMKKIPADVEMSYDRPLSRILVTVPPGDQVLAMACW